MLGGKIQKWDFNMLFLKYVLAIQVEITERSCIHSPEKYQCWIYIVSCQWM